MTAKRMRRALAAAAACCLFVLFLLPVFSAAAAAGETRRTVRVGLPDTDTAGTAGADNRTVAFQKDYMQAVAEYADWDCTFVEASWADCLAMIRSGEIDVLLDVTKTEERQAWFDFSSESMGTEMCYLYGPGDTALQYEDFDAFDGMTIGYEDGSLIVESLRRYGEQAGFSFTAKPYVSGDAMFAALDAGAVDAVVQTNFYDTPAGHVILAKLDPIPVYIATSKADPTLKTELDSAMALLFGFNPSFNADLFEYHFGGTAAQSVGYTRAEQAYLASRPVVDVYYETDWAPFECESGGKAVGITPEIIRAIGRDTGITFRFVLTSSTQDVYAGVGGSSSDTVMAVSYDYTWAVNHDLAVTQPYVTGFVMQVSRSGTVQDGTVAVVRDTYLEHQVHVKYPEMKTAGYDNYEACMQAVARGEADCTFLNYYQASYYRSMSAYEGFSYQPDENITQAIALGVTRGSDPALFGILSKSLQRISARDVQAILNENATQPEALSLQMLLRRHPLPMALLFACTGTLLGLMLVLLVTASVRKRQNVQLAAAKREAEAANSAKSEFLSRMSHDMRTPLNGIIGMTYLTERMELPAPARENLKKIDVSSKFLLNLINDLLDMTKAESGRIELHPEPYSAADFRQYVDAVIRPLCESKNQTFRMESGPALCCVPMLDKLRINQIVFNLLSNAVKYTPEGGTITCTVRAQPLPDAGRISLQIRVGDNGIGMSREFQKVLFLPFTQENRNDNSELRGSGLGLAITKRLVDLMGGTISVESEIGRGSVLTVDLTADCAPAAEALPAAQTLAAAEPALAGRHVLLCEDHPLNQQIAVALLTEKGMTVELADDGARGVSAFARSPVGYFDVVLMDVRMPVMDGCTAARAIRALDRPDAAAVPILALSADVLVEDVRKCEEAGMNGHVAKPIDPQVLYREIAAALGSRAAGSRLRSPKENAKG